MNMNPAKSSYQDLQVWQVSVELVVDCYRMAKQFPSIERFGLETELLRCAMTIPKSIADAWARRNTGIYLENITTSLGAIAQLETQILVAEKLNYCNPGQRHSLTEKMESIKWALIQMRRSLMRPAETRQAEPT